LVIGNLHIGTISAEIGSRRNRAECGRSPLG